MAGAWTFQRRDARQLAHLAVDPRRHVDAFAEHAIAADIKVKRPIQDQFYGHRDVLLADAFGYIWNVYTVKEEISVEEMHRDAHQRDGGKNFP